MGQEQNQNKKSGNRYLGVGVVIVVVAVVVYYVFFSESSRSLSIKDNSSDKTGTTTITQNGVTFEIPEGGGVKVEQVLVDNKKNFGPAPDLNRKVNFPKNFSEDAQTIFSTKLSAAKSAISKEPYSYDWWIQVGQLWNMIGDYEGTRQAFEYAAKISPSDYVAFGNLGFLYGYYLKEPVKAEANFLKAISNGLTQVYLYEQTFEFYRDVLKDKVKAADIADQGAKATGNTDYFNKLKSSL